MFFSFTEMSVPGDSGITEVHREAGGPALLALLQESEASPLCLQEVTDTE